MGSVSLRPYQESRAAGAVDLLDRGDNCAIVLPTGTGKTITALTVCDRLLQRAGGGECLWLVDRVALVDQTEEVAASLGIPVRIRTVQSLRRNGDKPPIEPGRYAAIVVDEVHGFLTELRAGYLRQAETPLLGLTATPRRGDGRHISELLGSGYVGGPYTLGQAIEDGWLCDAKVLRVELRDLDLTQVKRTRTDFDRLELAEVMDCEAHNDEVVRRWREVAETEGDIACSNLFACGCAHANNLAAEVNRQLGRDVCRPIHQKVTGARQLVRDFRAGEFRVASSVMMVAEGFDLPGLEVGVLARPTQSERLLVQMLGRFLRQAEGKAYATVLDCAGSYEGLNLASIYDVVAPHQQAEPALTESGDGPGDDPDAIPMLSDVISQVREIDLFRRRCAAARGGLPWFRLGARFVLPLHDGRAEAFVVVAQSRHDAGKVAAALLARRGHRAVCETLTRAAPEPEAFELATSVVRHRYPTSCLAGASRGAAERVERWFRDREQPSDAQLLALSRHGIDGSSLQRGEAQAEIRRLHARGHWTPAGGD